MKLYVGIYTGESSKDTLIRSPIELGGSPSVCIVDLLYDDGCLEIKERLSMAGIDCSIKPGDGMDFHSVSTTVLRSCIEALNNRLRQGHADRPDVYLEIGNLNNMMTGAMFLAAFRAGGKIVDYESGKCNILSNFKPMPNVNRKSFAARRILDALFQEDGLRHDEIARLVYADRIAGMSESEVTEFFNRHHNTYKVLQNLEEDGWIDYDRGSKTYRITPEGNTARVLFETSELREGRKML